MGIPTHPAASQPCYQAHATSEAQVPPDDLWAEYKVWVRGTKVWAGLDTLTRWPGRQHQQPAAKPAIRAGPRGQCFSGLPGESDPLKPAMTSAHPPEKQTRCLAAILTGPKP